MKKGFTIVELLIVIVVIAILAAIVMVAYNGVTRSANESSVKADLRNTATKVALYKSETDGYPLSLTNDQKVVSGTNELQYVSDGSTYCISVKTKATNGPRFFITQDGKIESGSCPLVWKQHVGGGSYSLAIASDNSVYGWGNNSYGQLGNNSTDSVNSPINISSAGVFGSKVIAQVESKNYHSLALASDGTVYAWGYNASGQLGVGSYADRSTPVNITASGALTGKTITKLAAGGSHSLALASDGTVYAWGYNGQGQLGDGSTTTRPTPISISTSGPLAGKTIVDIDAGSIHSMALASDGTVYVWGANNYAQLGNGTNTDQTTPINITTSGALAGRTISKVYGGGISSFALGSDGALYGWGANYYAQLGDGTNSGRSTPVSISTSGPLAGKTITEFSAGDSHALALASDGTLFVWGWNNFNQIGDGTTNIRYSPYAISSTGVLAGKTLTKPSASGLSSYVIASNGALYGWGYNGTGGLGNGSTNNALTPILLPAPQ